MSNYIEKESKLKFEISMELPFWINLREGNYNFSHRNVLKEKLAENGLETDLNKDYTDCILHIDNFTWRIGFDDFKEYPDIKTSYIMISEDVANHIFISDEILEEYFGDRKDCVFFQKLKTVVRRTYNIMLQFKDGIEKTEKDIVQKFADAIKTDFLKSINEFLEIYIGYFSSRSFCNDAYLLGETTFSYDKVAVKIEINNEDITHKVGFPTEFYSPPFYPTVFPSLDKEHQFFDLLNNNRFPSFTKVLKGLSNYFFLHGDICIGVLYLDMALESCINDFIKYYNEKNPEERIRRIKKNRTIRNFLIEDLPNILESVIDVEEDRLIGNVIQFHNERNLIIHRKKRKINESIVNQLRESVIKLINEFEKYMELPFIIKNQDADFIPNPIGIATEAIPGGSWGKIKLFKSFSDMVQHNNRPHNDN